MDDFYAEQDAYAARIGCAPVSSAPCCKYCFSQCEGRWVCPLKSKCGEPRWRGLKKKARPLSMSCLKADLAALALELVELSKIRGWVLDRAAVGRIWTGSAQGDFNTAPITILLQLMEEWRRGTIRKTRSGIYRFSSETDYPQVE
jgi:hypothetical protein